MTPHLDAIPQSSMMLSQLPTPTDIADKLWDHSPLTYLLVAGVIVLGGVVAFMFRKYDATVADRRKDDLQTLEVLKGISNILDTFMARADKHVQEVREDIKATQSVVKEKIEELKSHWSK
jgi:hypothetical protein